ncbi:AraC family transcriptional regulator [Arthrobacter sp. CAU 1506]|uniref:helix-turn-helix domain-containing protein n=1 Tax=Arthrobacter sp. CAU 1506 TaxID=2560052 RepID=UPI0010AD2303|nr:helix-turn-helix domain-containing protein [Arthrobacter sp. CAU 1506]TJY69567.1 AraC family transcriptional regulator [Arthrobacter sp. CAU 1506]
MSFRPTTKGHLTPGTGSAVTRFAARADVAAFVRQIWIPEWDLPAGEQAEQLVLGYPASNVVVEPDGVAIYGPTSRASTRVLIGSGWAVGALLKPAGVRLFAERPAELLDADAPIAAADLHRSICDVMASPGAAERSGAAESGPADFSLAGSGPPVPADAAPAAAYRARAADLLQDYVVALAAQRSDGGMSDEAALANQMVDLIDEGDIRSAPQLARALHLSERSVQRLASRYVGMSAVLMLRRRRLQDAAERVRADPATDLGELAAELGFSDQAHLTREFRQVLGFTPRQYPGSPAA